MLYSNTMVAVPPAATNCSVVGLSPTLTGAPSTNEPPPVPTAAAQLVGPVVKIVLVNPGPSGSKTTPPAPPARLVSTAVDVQVRPPSVERYTPPPDWPGNACQAR